VRSHPRVKGVKPPSTPVPQGSACLACLAGRKSGPAQETAWLTVPSDTHLPSVLLKCLSAHVQGGTDVGDHPPITPVRSATEAELGGGIDCECNGVLSVSCFTRKPAPMCVTCITNTTNSQYNFVRSSTFIRADLRLCGASLPGVIEWGLCAQKDQGGAHWVRGLPG
jgi:hypothetical protein